MSSLALTDAIQTDNQYQWYLIISDVNKVDGITADDWSTRESELDATGHGHTQQREVTVCKLIVSSQMSSNGISFGIISEYYWKEVPAETIAKTLIFSFNVTFCNRCKLQII